MLPNKSGKIGRVSMLNIIRTFLLLATTLIIGCASSPSGKSVDSAMGEWRYEFQRPSGQWAHGKMTIIDETKATYGFDNGRILFYAVDDQGKWEGYWVEDSGAGCPDKKDGSTNWGVAIFQFDDAHNQFEGTWNHCGEGRKLRWTGTR